MRTEDKHIISYIKKLLSYPRKKHQAHSGLPPLTGSPAIIPRHQHTVSRSDINQKALKILSRLHNAGFQAYLVGGSVRDLLMRTTPKDFDIATSAKPEQVRKLFRNCRLIGRRFRLAHIHFGREIIEVATFRCAGKADGDEQQQMINGDGMIIRDNVYGTLEDDAKRRDFTINALYYDSSNFTIIDYAQGFADLQQKVIRIIGDPEKRYLEDPVRMLRAIRFQTKLGFTLDPDTMRPIPRLAERLQSIPSARLFEETLKLLQHGQSQANYLALEKLGLFNHLFPIVAEYRRKNDTATHAALLQATLQNTDQRIADARPITPAFLFAAILWHPLLALVQELQSQDLAPLPALEEAMDKIIRQQIRTTAIPKRFVNVIREIWLLQYRLPRRYGKKAFRLLEHPRFRAGYDFLLLRSNVGDESTELAQWWTQFQSTNEEQRVRMVKKLPHPTSKRRVKRKKQHENS